MSRPFDSFTNRTICISGTDDLLGFDLEDCPKFGYPKVLNCKKSTPSARMIEMEQTNATILYEDNQGALLMANAQRPTKHTRHMDVKHFVIQQWVGQDLLNLRRINSADNYSDVLTKATVKILFRRHMDHIMGSIKPEYAHMIG